jgi:hypothetical protein
MPVRMSDTKDSSFFAKLKWTLTLFTALQISADIIMSSLCDFSSSGTVLAPMGQHR